MYHPCTNYQISAWHSSHFREVFGIDLAVGGLNPLPYSLDVTAGHPRREPATTSDPLDQNNDRFSGLATYRPEGFVFKQPTHHLLRCASGEWTCQ